MIKTKSFSLLIFLLFGFTNAIAQDYKAEKAEIEQLLNQAVSDFNNAQYDKALESSKQALINSFGIHDNLYIAQSYNTLGVIYNECSDTKKGIEFYEKALSYAKKANNDKLYKVIRPDRILGTRKGQIDVALLPQARLAGQPTHYQLIVALKGWGGRLEIALKGRVADAERCRPGGSRRRLINPFGTDGAPIDAVGSEVIGQPVAISISAAVAGPQQSTHHRASSRCLRRPLQSDASLDETRLNLE